MKFGPTSRIRVIHFEETEIPSAHFMPDIAVAGLDRFDIRKIRDGLITRGHWLAWSRWQAGLGENSEAFRRRIVNELKAEGVSGELVFVYSRGAFWQRNVACKLIPDDPDYREQTLSGPT
jgi:hypothetical protein